MTQIASPTLAEVVAELRGIQRVGAVLHPERLDKAVQCIAWLDANGDQIKQWKALAAFAIEALGERPEVAAILEAFPGAVVESVTETETKEGE